MHLIIKILKLPMGTIYIVYTILYYFINPIIDCIIIGNNNNSCTIDLIFMLFNNIIYACNL